MSVFNDWRPKGTPQRLTADPADSPRPHPVLTWVVWALVGLGVVVMGLLLLNALVLS